MGEPTGSPSGTPTKSPTPEPTGAPSGAPTQSPTPALPTKLPTAASTSEPTGSPSGTPTKAPTAASTPEPSASPNEVPTKSPTTSPVEPTLPPVEPTSPPVEPTSPPVEDPDDWELIFEEGFESGDSEHFIKADKRIVSSDGENIIRIKKKQKLISRQKTISAFSEVKIEFNYRGQGTETDDDKFALQYKFNGSDSQWTDAKEWTSGEHFNNNEWIPETVTISTASGNGKPRMSFRFVGRGNQNNDHIYIDDIKFWGK